jgi:hypothetical protein
MDLAKNYNMIRVGDRWHYRRRVPQDLLHAFDGKQVIKFSLNTNDVKLARQRRDVEDVKWNEKIFQLRNPGKNAEAKLSFLSTEETRQLVREHVREELLHFSKDMENGPPLTDDERKEIELNQLFEIQNLRQSTGQAEEWLSRTWDRLEQKVGNSDRQLQASEAHFHFLMRGLLEIANLKVRQLGLDFSKGYVDPAFDPQIKPQHTFGELAKDYLSHYKEAAKLNGRTAKAVDKVEQNVGLMVELVGSATLLTTIDYDFTEQLKIRLARVPSNYKKIYPGKTISQA